jgi:LuxR family maltose regulon positive regulatory protein
MSVGAGWLIETKFSPAARGRRQIERDRILDGIAAADQRLVVVQAAAGFGKSTLLGQWAARAEERGARLAWLNLDEDDREPDQFAAYLVEALRRAMLRGPADPAGSVASYAGLPAKAALAAAVHELETCGLQVALVLDDYHRAESEPVDALMRSLIDRAPGNLRIALASRSQPRLGLARLKAEGRAAIVFDRDLRFNDDETSLFFAAEMPRLDHQDWARFSARAEGWPVALQFARMWIHDGGSLSALSAASEATDLGSYLSEQVFATLRPDQQRLLLVTAPLESVSEGLADAVGVSRAGPLIQELVRSALPIVILSPDPLRFRCHHLFQDFLLSRAEAAEIDLAVVHRKAAAWFAASGDPAAAVRHALAGGDPATAAAILEAAGGWGLIYRGQGHLGAILRSVWRALGGAAGAPPRLLLGAAVVAAKGGDLATASAITAAIAARGLRGQPDLADEVHVLDALMRLYLDQPLPVEGLDRLMALAGRMEGAAPMTLALATNLAAFFTLELGSYARAKRYGERAIRHFREADAQFGEIHLYSHIGQADLAMGNLGAAAASYRTMRELCRRWLGKDSDLEAIATVLEAEERYEADDRAKARRLLESALGQIERGDGWFDIFAAGYLTAIRLELADHGPAAAFAAIERGLATAERRGMGRLATLLRQEVVRVATLSGDLDRAVGTCTEIGISLSPVEAATLPPPVSSVRGDGPALLAARLALRLGHARDAEAFLDVAERQSGGGTPLTRRMTARALRALTEAAEGRRERALAALTVATGLAGPEPFVRTFLDEGDALRELAAELAAASGVGAPVRRRLTRLRPSEADGPVAPADRPAGDFGLSPREHEILDLLAEGLSNKEIARRIARDPNTVKYHLKSLFAKLAVERRGRAVVRARDIGLIR